MPEGDEWVEYGGEMIWAAGTTAGGVPYGFSLEEWQRDMRTDESNAGWCKARDILETLVRLQSPGGASRLISAMTGISRLNIDIESVGPLALRSKSSGCDPSGGATTGSCRSTIRTCGPASGPAGATPSRSTIEPGVGFRRLRRSIKVTAPAPPWISGHGGGGDRQLPSLSFI